MSTTRIPSKLTAELAEEMAQMLTTLEKTPHLAWYTGILLLHVSWKSGVPLALDEYEDRFMGLRPQAGQAASHYFERLAAPSVFLDAPGSNVLEQKDAQIAYEAALEWASILVADNVDIGALHGMLLSLWATLVCREQETQAVPAGSLLNLDVNLAEPQKAPEHGYPLYGAEDVRAALSQKSAGPQEESNATLVRTLSRMSLRSPIRALAQTLSLSALDELYARFPHFSEVLDFIKGSLALAGCGEDGHPSIVPPILLKGEPGTGKSFFAQELATVLGTTYTERDLAVTSEAFVLMGMDSSWRQSKPGVIFDTLFEGEYANPLICLNEVDKARTSGTTNSPISALYTLLEPSNAEKFKDEFVGVAMDARKIIWVLTANKGEIPEAILSRLEVFDIPLPTPEQSKAIARSVWDAVLRSVLPKGHGFPSELPESVMDVLGALSPRLMRKALRSAASSAVLAGRRALEAADIEAAVREPSRTNGIGFLR